ncbi:MAG: hypothetical protein GYA34_00865 [Chloroflexi bacterium]|nr:hypothetical protein [Chloroflexota bacterium]
MIERIRGISDLHKTILMMIIWICIIVLLIILSGCEPFENFFNQASYHLEQTSAALDLRSTQLALQATQYYQGAAETAFSTRIAQDVQATYQAGLTQPIGTLSAQENHIASITTTKTPELHILPIQSVPPPAEEIPQAVLMEKIKSSNILLFEDMAGWGGSRFIKDALDLAGYSYTDVGSAQGWLRNNMLSNKSWDLIIVASETRTKIQGEFFDLLLDEIHHGTAIIIEIWDGDVLAKGKLRYLLSECGIEVHDDWYNPNIRTIFWLIPNHPIFQEPNAIASIKESYFWADDIGDLVRIVPGGDAVLLAGTKKDNKDDHGVLTTCFDGRVIIQSFSSHDYERAGMIDLWQNYIFFTLKNHYQYKP